MDQFQQYGDANVQRQRDRQQNDDRAKRNVGRADLEDARRIASDTVAAA